MTTKEFMAVRKPKVCRLGVGEVFQRLSHREKSYAHHMARAAWSGTNIILRQVSPESTPIFYFILELYKACDGDWDLLGKNAGVSISEMDKFLDYAAIFLANIGNYYGHGDQKFIPDLDHSVLKRLLTALPSDAQVDFGSFECAIIAELPSGLGFPSDQNQSAYYHGARMTREEVQYVNKLLGECGIHADNTRLRKIKSGERDLIEVLQASVNTDVAQQVKFEELEQTDSRAIRRQPGDHSVELQRVINHLEKAKQYALNERQVQIISLYQDTFLTGNIETYKSAQKLWVKDIKPAVESVLGFVEPYRDPFGVRAEFEGLVAIVDEQETKTLSKLVDRSATFIKTLPWVEELTNDGHGPFERDLFDPPDYTSLHVLAYCSSIIFLGLNLPNYNDIRQTVGFKNLMVANRNQPLTTSDAPPFILSTEAENYIKHAAIAWKLQITLHELFGHGTGKLLVQGSSATVTNFDISNPPTNPLNKQPITSWYRPGETWNSVFGDIAASVDECRAELVGTFLMSEKEILEIFGFTDSSTITANDLIYNIYLQLGVLGLRALESYSSEDEKWGQAHDRGHFAMFRTLLAASNFMTITSTPSTNTLQVSIDRSKILTHGRPALSSLLLKLHIYRCTADISTCRAFYEELTRPDEQCLEWRRIVLANRGPRQIFVQANTFVRDDGEIELREYEMSVRGLIQSWAERGL